MDGVAILNKDRVNADARAIFAGEEKGSSTPRFPLTDGFLSSYLVGAREGDSRSLFLHITCNTKRLPKSLLFALHTRLRDHFSPTVIKRTRCVPMLRVQFSFDCFFGKRDLLRASHRDFSFFFLFIMQPLRL